MSDRHDAQIALMKFLSTVARRAGVADHVYIVGGAVRDFVMGRPIKDVDVVVDAVSLGRGRDSAWFAQQVVRSIPVASSYVTNQYGVAIITVKGSWVLDGHDLGGEVIEVANARKESYGAGGDSGKGYKPTDVQPATILEDVERREFTWNTLLWRLRDLADGPAKAEVIDLTGCGLRDLSEGVMRCPRDPDVVFSDDPTRMLRLVKFVGRYGFKVPPDVAASVRRNAGKMANAPWEAIATILVRDVIEKPYARRVLPMMRELGLMDAIIDLVAKNPPFRTYLERELRGKPAHLVADLLEHGLTDPTPVKALTPDQRARFVEIVRGLSPVDAELLSNALQRPPVDNSAIIAEFSLRPDQRGRIAPLARELLLNDPALASDAVALTDAVRESMRSGRTAKVKELIPGGRARNLTPSNFDPDELARGVKVEREHTPDPDLAREIAMDHLTEFPDYYTRLDRMESEAKSKTSGHREVPSYGGLTADWEYNGPTQRVYSVRSSHNDLVVGELVWDKRSNTWSVYAIDGETRLKVLSFTSVDDREGVKRSLLALSGGALRNTRKAAVPKKYEHIDFKPPQGVADAAEKGLELRQKASPSNRGGLTPGQASKEGIGSGVQRAVNLKNRDTVSPDVIRQMAAFFARHEKNKDVPSDKKGEPWNAKGYVAWLLWGGDPGRTWAEKVRGQMDAADENSKTATLEAAWGQVIPHVESRVAGMFSRSDMSTPEQVKAEFDHNLALFRRGFDDAMRTMTRYGDTPEVWAAGRAAVPASAAFDTFIHGRALSYLTAQVKLVPPPHRRLFETARREFARTRKFDYPTWFGKNIAMLRMMYDVGSWPDVATPETEGGDAGDVTLIGSLRVVNQSGQDPDKAVDLIRRAARAMSDSGVPSITKVLYGDVFVVGEVARKKAMAARYFPDRDIIEVLAVKRFAEHQLRSTVHEFGHRYWRKFMAPAAKRAWEAHHTEMSYATPDYEFPKVGEVVDYIQGRPTVSEVTQGIIKFEGGGLIVKSDLVNFLRDRARASAFPTPYAATNAEEHFCESLSLFCLGNLTGSNLAAFKVIVLGETAEQAELSLVASWGYSPRTRR